MDSLQIDSEQIQELTKKKKQKKRKQTFRPHWVKLPMQ